MSSPKVIATPAGEGEPVNSPAEVDTDSSGQESTKGSAGGSSADEAPGGTPSLDHGELRGTLRPRKCQATFRRRVRPT